MWREWISTSPFASARGSQGASCLVILAAVACDPFEGDLTQTRIIFKWTLCFGTAFRLLGNLPCETWSAVRWLKQRISKIMLPVPSLLFHIAGAVQMTRSRGMRNDALATEAPFWGADTMGLGRHRTLATGGRTPRARRLSAC